jgi:argininosuccinate lyase
MSKKPWGGRFTESTNKSVEQFSSSIGFDKRLYSFDIEGSVAHCKMLGRQRIISDDEAFQLIEGLGKIKREIEHGEFEYHDSLEDIHMHIETRLLQLIGKTAHKLHTARSRNDQIALDTRMYLRHEIQQIIHLLHRLRQVLVDLAEAHMGLIMPGYTHLQRAQPVLFSHHLMAYYEMLTRDTDRFQDSLKRVDVMPLGSAALAGTTYPIDRHYTAEVLGFSRVSANSIDSVSDRDFIIEFLSSASICMAHFSRLSEELIMWSSSEFSFIEISDDFTTGSSIMPQKKNPDAAELVRGKTGRIYGNLISLLTIMKSLPLSYNRDMQEDKEPLFDTVDTLKACIEIYCKMLPRITVNQHAMARATTSGYLNATDMTDYLVNKGMAFREAHEVVGKAVQYALREKKELHQLNLDELKTFSSLISDDIYTFLDVEQIVKRRNSYGGTGVHQVKQAIIGAKTCLVEAMDPEKISKD